MRSSTHRLLLLAVFATAAVPAHAQAAPGRRDPCVVRARPAAPAARPAPRLLGTPVGEAPAQPAASPPQEEASPSAAAPARPGPRLLGTPVGEAPAQAAANPPQEAAAPTAAAPQQPGANPPAAAAAGDPQPAGAAPSTAPAGTAPQGRFSDAGGTMADSAQAERNREALRLGMRGLPNRVRLGPAASVSVPTAFGVDAGEVFLGAGYQGRTRYTEEDDAAAVAGIGLGTRRLVALEVAVTTYSTLRGSPFETGGLSFKVHRALPRNASLAVGWENAVLWGGSDDEGSVYGVATQVVNLRPDPAAPFSVAVLSLGVGNGRFRFEEDDAADRQTANVFAALGIRVSEPISLVADWTGQDLNMAASATPLPGVPVVLTMGLADLTGSAGDGIRFILSLGYGTSFRLPN